MVSSDEERGESSFQARIGLTDESKNETKIQEEITMIGVGLCPRTGCAGVKRKQKDH